MITSTRKFDVDVANRHFVGEKSEIGSFVQIYPDAADEGLRLISNRTGNETEWVVDRHTDHDGELVAWHLIPTSSTIRKFPQLRGWTMTVYND